MSETKYQELPETFISRNHEHHCVRRTHGLKQDVALYRRTNLTHENPTPHYEVILIGKQEAGERNISGSVVRYESRETYPTDQMCGTHGFTFQKYHNAEGRFETLAKRGRGKVVT